jgi:two-component system response regulator AtoC
MSKTILVADDDAALRELAVEILTDAGYDLLTARDGVEAIAIMNKGGVDLVVTDMRMPGGTGMDVVRAAQRRSPSPPVVLLTAFGTIDGAVDAMRAGAFDYLTKPVESPAALRAIVARALKVQPTALPAPPPGTAHDEYIAVDPVSAELVRVLDLVAVRDTTVLLIGESGSGKEVAARRIHQRSPRAGGPFVAVNCGAIVADLFESKLFGHTKGAFTGAAEAREGVFEAADGGTLLLDEVGELPLESQVKLLRALEERRITRVGENRERAVDVRVIAATLRDLPSDVAAGLFREDLYYRLSVFPIIINPLRERPRDIIPLAMACLRALEEPDRSLSADAKAALTRHAWPGNARELRNVMERAVILAGAGPIEPPHLNLRPTITQVSTEPANLKELERRAIESALVSTHGNRRLAAEKLGIAVRTLQYKLKEYGLITAE